MFTEHRTQTLAACARHLSDFGLAAEGLLDSEDALSPRLTLHFKDGRREIDVEAHYRPTITADAAFQFAHSSRSRRVLIIADRIHGRTADTIRDTGIWYIDSAGNAYIRDSDLIIDVRGRRPTVGSPPTAALDTIEAPANTNLFSTVRSQIICAILTRPDLLNQPYRVLAEHSGASLGATKATVDLLSDSGFVERFGRKTTLARGPELLDSWAQAYPNGLGRSNEMMRFEADPTAWHAPDSLIWAVSGEQAAPEIIRNPQTLTLYVKTPGREIPADIIIANRWRKSPTGSIHVSRMFWTDLPGFRDMKTAPAPLVFADLLASREARQIEAANDLRRFDVRFESLRPTRL
ncbi:type IV toxin-antitoxin system AbiEi family antitoxin [Gordonia phthalatica]|uniref:HTH iclR-type domain-containing protein n=1 Tax=Gordonia phthalatica TaxID=1136941 RepID=A0A0N9N7A6_9ACTN|nr:type IV toxin-antitoxin system AbiEi family antitoxin [Gordonia phthalatica]ALG83869.1 hypothetical protein ACH46_04270 [Gordonia phthalatica]